jgi:hypothetical protein
MEVTVNLIFVNASKGLAKLPSQITKDHILYDSIFNSIERPIECIVPFVGLGLR